MKKRKVIAFITALPESIHAKRLLQGITGQCEQYGYNVAVFSTMVQACFVDKVYLDGEINIYELINFDLIDAILVDTLSLTEDDQYLISDYLIKKFEKETDIPVISIDKKFGKYPVISSDDDAVFRKTVEHFILHHGCKDIYFLTGVKDTPAGENRVRYFKNTMKKYGLYCGDDVIFYGDFWYTSGAELADKLISGKLRMPEAVVCASDHMAMGLVNRLIEHGINVPKDLLVCGFEATQEGALNSVSISSFEGNQVITGAKAVDYAASLIEPDRRPIGIDEEYINPFHPGKSCGCENDSVHPLATYKDSFYYMFRDYQSVDYKENMDIGQLLEGYMSESLTSAESPEKCFEKILLYVYLTRPYSRFYLCLRDDWLYTQNSGQKGYPEKMNVTVYTKPAEGSGYHCADDSHCFETKNMHPDGFDTADEPSVFYFAPLHFQDNTFGYVLLERPLHNSKLVNLVFRNWIRIVNTSLEMVRAKNKLLEISIKDSMTGAYNRRGMEMRLQELLNSAKEGDRIFVCVVDMDGLKYINDNFGHADGDFGIKKICEACMSVITKKEICARTGGDEYYIIGVGDYTEERVEAAIERFYAYLKADSQLAKKVYSVSASVGYELAEVNGNLDVDRIMNSADAKMYRNKYERKKNRGRE